MRRFWRWCSAGWCYSWFWAGCSGWFEWRLRDGAPDAKPPVEQRECRFQAPASQRWNRQMVWIFGPRQVAPRSYLPAAHFNSYFPFPILPRGASVLSSLAYLSGAWASFSASQLRNHLKESPPCWLAFARATCARSTLLHRPLRQEWAASLLAGPRPKARASSPSLKSSHWQESLSILLREKSSACWGPTAPGSPRRSASLRRACAQRRARRLSGIMRSGAIRLRSSG